MALAVDELSLVFQALADPTRRAIISRLHDGPTTVGELARPFTMSRPAISQHLGVLERAGLIERAADAQWRRCTLRTEPLNEVSAWVERHRREWNERFDLLEERLQELKGSPMPDQTVTRQKEFTITRLLDAPRQTVWRAWTDPDEAPYWFHHRSLATPRDRVDFDVRPGGAYRYTMVAADGAEYPTGGTYREVVPPERLVFTWGSPSDADDVMPVVTVELAEQGASGEKTLMTFRVDGVEGQPGDNSFYDGWAEALDLLAERVAQIVS